MDIFHRNSRYGQMILCDYCPKVYHLDCLDPPMTYYPPNKKFMCNLHPQKESVSKKSKCCCLVYCLSI